MFNKIEEIRTSLAKFLAKIITLKKGNFFILYTKTYVVSNEHNYLTERQFQEKIVEGLKDFFENPNSEYFEILTFIKNYNFKR